MSDEKRKVNWGLLSVALVPLGVVAAPLQLPIAAAIAVGAVGVLLVLFALAIPQHAYRRISGVHGQYIQRTLDHYRVEEALRLLSEAADAVHALLHSDQGAGGLVVRPGRYRGRQALSAYEQVHRAGVVHAVEAGIGVEVADLGTLALAEQPRDLADLHALHAGLLRMVLGLSHALSGAPAEAMAGGRA